MDTIELVTLATDYVERLISEGMEFPDAVWKASERFHIGHRMIEAMYDSRCN